jgi:hypothetical protein
MRPLHSEVPADLLIELHALHCASVSLDASQSQIRQTLVDEELPEHETGRKIIREWMLLPKDKRQTEKQAKSFAKTALQQRPESAGQCALGIPRKADMPQWQASRVETVQPRPLPRALASVAPRPHHGSQHPD